MVYSRLIEPKSRAPTTAVCRCVGGAIYMYIQTTLYYTGGRELIKSFSVDSIRVYIYMIVYVRLYIRVHIICYIIYPRTWLSWTERSSESKGRPFSCLSAHRLSSSTPSQQSVLWQSARAYTVCVCVHKSFRLTNKPCIFASKLLFTHVNGTSIKDTGAILPTPTWHTHTHTHTHI